VLYVLSVFPYFDIVLIFGENVHYATPAGFKFLTAVTIKSSVSREVSQRSNLKVK
jgi:hypothetical protein